ncbi:MAG TPA: methylmalonyl Co-A mutase-associated GTPase MeaB, partial [Streptosporangiaceae bacterium]|nr:methylmalonyl Co-A mutase-associated GTPase MeaB [Streptosporangiaceae bacterium]
DWLAAAGQGDARRLRRVREEISAIALGELRQRMGGLPGESRLDELAGRVVAGDLDPYSAADELISG